MTQENLKFKQMLHDFLFQNDEEIDYRSYSGRGMYGDQCPAIVTSDIEQLMVDITCFIYDCGEFEDCEYEMTDILRDCRRDSMGMKSVVYWPQVKWVDDDSSGENEEEE